MSARTRIASLSFGIAVAALANNASAGWGDQLLVNQFDSVASSTSMSYLNPDPANPSPANLITADDFTVGTGGYLSEIRIKASQFWIMSPPAGARVTIFANTALSGGGAPYGPGAVLYQRDLPVASGGDPNKVGIYDTGTGEFQVTLPAGDFFNYSAGTYWVSVQARQKDGDFKWFYRGPQSYDLDPLQTGAPASYMGSADATPQFWYKQRIPGDFLNDPHWKYSLTYNTVPTDGYNVDMAMQLYGGATAVPEPACATLMAAGVMLLLRRRSRRS
jgi:hypothetical protein